MRIVFFGTNRFAAEILQSLAGNFEVVAAVTQPDKPIGRKQEMHPSDVAQKAEQLGIRALKPSSLKDEPVQAALKSFGADLFVVAAYGKIIPKNILEIPAKGAINVHGSLLPKYRGASPIHAALLNGDKETGITIMLMDEQMDHGQILLEKSLEIESNDTFPILEQKLCNLAQNLLLKAIKGYINRDIKPVEQDHSEATFVSVLTKDQGRINWAQPAGHIYNQYRALVLWPEVWTMWDGKVLKIKKCQVSNTSQSLKPGTVFLADQKVFVQCASGSLELVEVQAEGKKQMPIEDFLRGHKDFMNSVLV